MTASIVAALVFGLIVGYVFGFTEGVERERMDEAERRGK